VGRTALSTEDCLAGSTTTVRFQADASVYLLAITYRSAAEHIQHPLQWVPGTQREADLSLPSHTAVKNAWILTSTTSTLLGVVVEDCTSAFNESAVDYRSYRRNLVRGVSALHAGVLRSLITQRKK
jgi:hypothetical protein